MTRILGIDPGSQRTGIGVIDVAGDGRCTFVHAQAIVLLGAEDFPSRLGLLCEGLEALLDEWQPQQVARLLGWLEDLDDMQAVYSNVELGEDAYA